MPIGPSGLEAQPGELSHQVQFRRPHVPVRRCMVNQSPVDHHPMTGPCDLADQVVEGLDADVVWLAHEDPGNVTRRNPAELRHDHLDDEPATGFEVRGRIPEDVRLFGLGRHVHDRVPHQVHQVEASVRPR